MHLAPAAWLAAGEGCAAPLHYRGKHKGKVNIQAVLINIKY